MVNIIWQISILKQFCIMGGAIHIAVCDASGEGEWIVLLSAMLTIFVVNIKC